jgi:putative membrane protein
VSIHQKGVEIYVPSKDVTAPERTLVLCVDRDDDLGVKAGVKTPVLGREENINAAVTLALRDPEEPDANAIFEAVKIYDRLRESADGEESHGECQIATIAGSELGDVGADKELVSELTEVLKGYPASEVVLVTDGFADETILPLVQSRVPVTSVRRVTVRHSESIEETVWLFSRYVKMLFDNPRYARMALGLPGLLLIILAVLYVLNWTSYSLIALLIVLGAYLVVKGFMIDKAVGNLYRWIREYSPPSVPNLIMGFVALAGFLLIAIGAYQGYYQASSYASTINPPLIYPSDWIVALPKLFGHFLSEAIFLTVVGIFIALFGRAVHWLIEHDSRLLRTVDIMVVVAWSYQIFYQASKILIDPALPYETLVFSIAVGIILAVASVIITSLLHRLYPSFFHVKEKQVEES